MNRLSTLLALASLAAGCSTANVDANADNKTSAPFDIAVIAQFHQPWAMTFLPDSPYALITEQKGRLLLWEPGGRMQSVMGVPMVDYGGQGGLGDVILSPDFTTNSMIYLSWVEAGEGDTHGAVVGRARLDRDDPEKPKLSGVEIIWHQYPKVKDRGHFGHRIAFGPDGMLYI